MKDQDNHLREQGQIWWLVAMLSVCSLFDGCSRRRLERELEALKDETSWQLKMLPIEIRRDLDNRPLHTKPVE